MSMKIISIIYTYKSMMKIFITSAIQPLIV